MESEQSYGVVPVYKNQLLIVYNKKGHWALPKGHQDPGETPQQTAFRELAEETGITDVELDEGTTFEEKYQFEEDGERIDKTVTYFIGFVKSKDVKFDDDLIKDGKWLSFDDAIKQATFPATKQVLKAAQAHLNP